VKIPVSCVIEAGFVKSACVLLRESCSVVTVVNVNFGRSAVKQV
jgi:hypothetical protein